MEKNDLLELKEYMSSIPKMPLLTALEEQELAKEKANGNQMAREKLIYSNLNLVIFVAKKFFGNCHHLKPLDIIQTGNMGLVRAVDGYVPGVGRFSTYAVPVIRGYINSMKRDSEDMIRIPGHMYFITNKILSSIQEQQISLEEALDHSFIEKTFNLPKSLSEDCVDYLKIHYVDTYNRMEREDDKVEIVDTISDNRDFVEEDIAYQDNILLFAALKNYLSNRDYFFLYHHVLSEDNKMTLTEIASFMRITPNRASQFMRSIISDMKDYYTRFNNFEGMVATLQRKVNVPVEKYNLEPVKVEDLVKYAYLAKDLSSKERELFKLEHFSLVNYDALEICEKLGISIEEYYYLKNNISNLSIALGKTDSTEFVSELKSYIFNLEKVEEWADKRKNKEMVKSLN